MVVGLGARAADVVFGDTDRVLSGFTRAGDQELILTSLPDGALHLVGDAPKLAGFAVGGDDELTALASTARVLGDAFALAGRARGGNDLVVAGGDAAAHAYGDAEALTGQAAGGDDEVRAGGDSGARAYGDAQVISGHARGGDDHVNADGLSDPRAYGDAEVIRGYGAGGDDTVTGMASTHGTLRLFGDAERLEGHSAGGDDVLIAPAGSAEMWGDAAHVSASASTGADRFVFTPTGQLAVRTIMDFEPGKDQVEFSGYGLSSFEDLASFIQPTASGVLIVFSGADWVSLAGIQVSQLSAGDFLFT